MNLLSLLTDVLMVGHSLVGPVLPDMVQAALAARGQPATVQAQIINGAPLAFQWQNGGLAEGVEGRAELARGLTDVLVLTEAIPLANQMQWNDSAGMVANWAEAAWDANPQTQVLVYETWHSLRSGPGAAIPDDPGGGVAWSDRVAADLAAWQSLTDRANAARPPGSPPVRLIPAGQAMARLAAEAAAGRVPGATGIRDFFDDDIHPNGKGLYLVAMVQAAVITGDSPVGLPSKLTRVWPNRRAVVPDDMALVLQRIASETVRDHRLAEDARLANPPPPPPEPVAAPPPPEPEAPAAAGAEPVASDGADAEGIAAEGSPVAAPAPTEAEIRAALMPAPDIAVLGGVTNPNLALGLAGVHDWSVQQPFLDVMKTARPWIAHKPGQWGGWDTPQLVAGGHVDAGGWPRALPVGATGMTTLVLTDLPEEAVHAAGRYVLRWQGKGELKVEGRVAQMDAGPDRIAFDYTPGPGSVILTLTAIDGADPIRDLSLVREDRLAAHAAGYLFNPDWLSRLRGVGMVRFMDWMATNDSTLSRAADRPKPDDFTWAAKGVPVEVMVALANELRADPWFNMPHLAEDALVRDMATVVRDGLSPDLQAYVEYSNEVWNWQFTQAQWAEDQGRARWGQDSTWVQFYALRAAEVSAIWSDVFGAEAEARLVRVISSQTGWLGLEEQVLDAPLVIAEGRPAPKASFDAYAVTGYFAAQLGTPEKAPVVKAWLAESLAEAETAADAQGLTGDARDAWIAAHRFDRATAQAATELESGFVTGQQDDTLVALLTRILPHHAAAAQAAGLDLIMYEGGTHVVGAGAMIEDEDLTAFFRHLNYAPEMGELYARLIAGWAGLTDAPFNGFVDVDLPSKWGSWGALRHLGDDNPRWRALAGPCAAC
ncbi:MAG: hypothetical protein ACT4OK_17165 [Gemmobacter sp.]